MDTAFESPPLTRGKPLFFMRGCQNPGITPAYAGETLKKSLKSALFLIRLLRFYLVYVYYTIYFRFVNFLQNGK